MLIRDIAAGRLASGERLPPEREMAASLGTSVGTLRKALADLEARRLLDRVQGSGNYVRTSDTPEGVYAFFRLETLDGGGLPTASVLAIDKLEKPADLPPFGASIEAHRIRRLRSLNGQPAAVEEIWLDGSYAEQLHAADISESLYLHYRQALGLWITHVEDRVGVGYVPDWAPTEFGLEAGAPTGLVERLSRAQDGASAEYSRNWFHPARVRYVSRMR
ncbi:MAG: GntR family transcriptional regulator [Devosiaceae bacterium]|nr:GntR family transcriptional regulator [Devosiaceae bacterium MH13]